MDVANDCLLSLVGEKAIKAKGLPEAMSLNVNSIPPVITKDGFNLFVGYL